MIYVTGDTHGVFTRVADFCQRAGTTKDDILIILGDAGVNFLGPQGDLSKKRMLQALPITLFCLHGNHEMRPGTIAGYQKVPWRGGTVYQETAFPNLLFAVDGEVYDIGGRQSIVIGGAYSIDKAYRLAHGWPWWPDEQPSREIKRAVEAKLNALNWRVDVVLSHTGPRKYLPFGPIPPGMTPAQVDQSTEIWLTVLEDRLRYDKWLCGHFHVEKKIARVEYLFESIKTWEDALA